MKQVIYRKYRPKSFDEIIGQNHIVSVLKEQIEQDSIGHAYLFTGPRGTGKTSIARIFAYEVNEIKYNEGQNIDIIEIDAASNRGIDEIRNLKEKIHFVPSKSKYKVYVIDEVHMLTKEAFNALLKTLEEPPDHIIFILATTEPHKVPVTILSRVMRFDFKLANREHLQKKFQYIFEREGIDYDEEVIDIVIKRAKGSYRDGESILEKLISSGREKKITYEDVSDILGVVDVEIIKSFVNALEFDKPEDAYKILKKHLADGQDGVQFAWEVLEYVNDVIADHILKNSNYNLKKYIEIQKNFSQALLEVKNSLLGNIPLEIAIFNTCSSKDDINNNVNDNFKQKEIDKFKKSQSKSIKKIKSYSERSNNDSQKSQENEAMKENQEKKSIEMTIENIQRNWSLVVKEAKSVNPHLSAFIIKSKPISIQKEVLLIEVPFKFHQKKLNQSRKEINKIFINVFGVSIEFDIMLEGEKENKNDTNITIDSNVDQVDSNKKIVETLFDI